MSALRRLILLPCLWMRLIVTVPAPADLGRFPRPGTLPTPFHMTIAKHDVRSAIMPCSRRIKEVGMDGYEHINVPRRAHNLWAILVRVPYRNHLARSSNFRNRNQPREGEWLGVVYSGTEAQNPILSRSLRPCAPCVDSVTGHVAFRATESPVEGKLPKLFEELEDKASRSTHVQLS
jgi:hypothetical protein